MSRDALIAPVLGAGTGVIFFVLLCMFFGRPLIPTVSATHTDPMANVVRPEPAGGAPGEQGVYQRICQTCHQADGKGMPGAFPPLAGSEWLTADPETPIRIVLRGLSGPIEVAGQSFNAIMPPPPGLTDADIAEAITHARTSFGNQASEVTEDMVAQVRAALAARSEPWTAQELQALRPGAGAVEAEQGDAPAESDAAVPDAEAALDEAPPVEGAAPEAAGEAAPTEPVQPVAEEAAP